MNTLRHAVWMAERGHKVFLMCVENTPLAKETTDSIVQAIYVNRNKKSFDYKNAKTVKRQLEPLNPSHVWFRDKRDLSVLALAKVLSRNKWKLIFQQAMQFGVNKKEFWHTIRFNRIDHWITPLHYLADQVKEKTKFPENRVHVIPLAIDIDRFIEGIPDKKEAREYFKLNNEDIVVGMIGRIDPHKAQDFVKEAVLDLQKRHKNLKMLMVGSKTEGEWESYYDNLKSEANRDDRLFLYPFMKEVGYFYAATDIFVMASKNETFGMVTIEAMLAGKQIAGTNSAGTKELIGEEERGYFFNWEDKKSLTTTLNEMLNKQDEANKRAALAKEYALKQFSHKKECEEIEKILNT